MKHTKSKLEGLMVLGSITILALWVLWPTLAIPQALRYIAIAVVAAKAICYFFLNASITEVVKNSRKKAKAKADGDDDDDDAVSPKKAKAPAAEEIELPEALIFDTSSRSFKVHPDWTFDEGNLLFKKKEAKPALTPVEEAQVLALVAAGVEASKAAAAVYAARGSCT